MNLLGYLTLAIIIVGLFVVAVLFMVYLFLRWTATGIGG